MSITTELLNKVLFFDGAMGTMLQMNGLKLGEMPELLNINNPSVVTDIHRQFLAAGSDVITANTFGANRLKFKEMTEEIILSGISLAKKAASEFSNEKKRYVALDIGPLGKLLKPLGKVSFEEAYSIFSQVAITGEKGGADLCLIETMSDTYETKAAVLAVKENTSLPIFCSMTFDQSGKALTGGDITSMVALLEGLGVDALGINCGLGPIETEKLFEELNKYASIPVIIQPNAGIPTFSDGESHYDVEPNEFAKVMKRIAIGGANILGGCCGTTPMHIKQLVLECSSIVPATRSAKDDTIVCSYSKSVIIGKKPVIIGERINPTGKKKFKEALSANNINYILGEAVTQQENGADILDVNVGLPGIDEAKMMETVVSEIQAISNLPLQIDSSDPLVIERALRIYNGKAIINSVNCKQEVMDAIFPIVKKYGGVVVALLLDEDGIPETALGRLNIAKRIVQEAEKYGIKKKDILVDALTLTVSAQQKEANETLSALRMVKELGLKTVLGVSNISFGLPKRDIINSVFFGLALQSGLDACIINPCSPSMMDVYRAYNVLAGHDEQCMEYVKTYSDTAQTQVAEMTLFDIVVKGLKDLSYDLTVKKLKDTAPLEIIEKELIPALDFVGNGFEKGTMFLPQLIMSAETVKNAFSAIKTQLESQGTKHECKGKILLATVEGDIHDIGKNIVKVMLENYGFDCIDLGKNVPVADVVKIAIEQDIKLVGLSALMTTTVVSMEKTIKALKDKKPDCLVIVGGAVLTEDYAKEIGADFYAKDAMESVRLANKIFS